MKLNLKQEAGPTVDIGHGEYNRQFNRVEQPFTVDDVEAGVLLATGLFEPAGKPVAGEAEKRATKATSKEAKN